MLGSRQRSRAVSSSPCELRLLLLAAAAQSSYAWVPTAWYMRDYNSLTLDDIRRSNGAVIGCAWGDSVLAITDLTPDLRRLARAMEREKYPEAPAARPPPLRIQGRRGRGGGSEFLGSKWAGEGGGP